MSVDPNDPINLVRNILGNPAQDACDLGDFILSFRRQVGAARLKQNLGGKHETVTNNTNAFLAAQHFSHPPEEIAAIFLQILFLGLQRLFLLFQPNTLCLFQLAAFTFLGCGTCQRRVQIGPQRFKLHPRCGITRLIIIQQRLKAAQLGPQRGDLLVQQGLLPLRFG